MRIVARGGVAGNRGQGVERRRAAGNKGRGGKDYLPAAPEGEWIAEEGAARTVGRNNYSLLVCLDSESGIEELMDEYRKGTKLYLLAAAPEIYDRILDCFQGLLRNFKEWTQRKILVE